jgi:AraC-like DNA-binding protein
MLINPTIPLSDLECRPSGKEPPRELRYLTVLPIHDRHNYQAPGCPPDDARVSVTSKAVWYIESHLSGDLSLETIAAAIGVSRFYLSCAFGLGAGWALASYVRRRRLTEAARSLAGGHLQHGRHVQYRLHLRRRGAPVSGSSSRVQPPQDSTPHVCRVPPSGSRVGDAEYVARPSGITRSRRPDAKRRMPRRSNDTTSDSTFVLAWAGSRSGCL